VGRNGNADAGAASASALRDQNVRASQPR
jgi:hypothetical protein